MQMAEFNKAVAGDVLAAEEAEEAEATDFAAERAAWEAFEQQCVPNLTRIPLPCSIAGSSSGTTCI